MTFMNKKLIIAGALGLGMTVGFAAPAFAAPIDADQIVLWEKPVDGVTFGPQHLIKYQDDTGDLNALDSYALPGHCYQADRYTKGQPTVDLITGAELYSPNNPVETLLPGGDGVAYKTWCVPEVVVTPTPTPTPVPPTNTQPPVAQPKPPVAQPQLAQTGVNVAYFIGGCFVGGLVLTTGIILKRKERKNRV